MKDCKGYILGIAFCIIFNYAIGYIAGYSFKTAEIEKIQNEITEYKWQLESCHQQIGDMQDDYDVNNDGLINAQDYVAIKNYIMDRDAECYVNGGWNCE